MVNGVKSKSLYRAGWFAIDTALEVISSARDGPCVRGSRRIPW